MAIRTESYGSVAEVAVLVKRYTNAGTFDETAESHPKLSHVESLIDKVSGIINTVLAQHGFTIPVTQADAALGLDEFVIEIVAALCEEANGAGRFFSEGQTVQSLFNVVRDEAKAFIAEYHQGIEGLGAARSRRRITAWLGDKSIAIAEV